MELNWKVQVLSQRDTPFERSGLARPLPLSQPEATLYAVLLGRSDSAITLCWIAVEELI